MSRTKGSMNLAMRELHAQGLKRCNGPCRQVKPHSEFNKNGNQSVDGLYSRCKVCVAISRKAWRENNREKYNAFMRQWRERNLEHSRAKHVEYEATRRARKLGQFVETVDRLEVYTRHGGICGICDEPVDVVEFEVDHVTPLAAGGLHGYNNVQPSHVACNRRKGAKVKEQRYE